MLIAVIAHIVICVAMVSGMLFCKTPTQAYAVLANLIVIFLGLRLFKGCMLSLLEEDATTGVGKIFILEIPTAVTTHNFEEIIVGFSLILQLIRTFVLVFKLEHAVF